MFVSCLFNKRISVDVLRWQSNATPVGSTFGCRASWVETTVDIDLYMFPDGLQSPSLAVLLVAIIATYVQQLRWHKLHRFVHFTIILILMREITPLGIKSHWFSLGARWSLLAESSSWTSKKTQVQQRSGLWWSHATHGSGILLDREKEYELIYYSGNGNGNKTKLSAKVGLWSQL